MVKRAVGMKSGPSNVSVIHFQNVACFDASSQKKKRQTVSTKIQHLLLWIPLQVYTFLWLSRTITRPLRCAVVWCIALFPIVLLSRFSYSQLPQQVCTYLILTLLHIYLISFFLCLLKPGDLSLTSVSLWSFKQIAKEKFSMPLRDNYQTVKLPRSSRWVITFPPSLFFSPKWNHQFLKPWQSTIPWRCSPSDFWMKTVRSKCCPLRRRLKVFLDSHILFFILSLSPPHSSLAWSHIHTNNSSAHLHSGQLHSICKPVLNFSRIRFC